MDLPSFRKMLGALGQTYIGERLFKVIAYNENEKTGEQNDVITIDEYMTYQDVLYYGSDEEKNRYQFLFLNLNLDHELLLEEFVEFQINYMTSMATVFQYNMDIEHIKLASRETFKVLAGGADKLSREDLLKIRKEKPHLLEWINKPE